MKKDKNQYSKWALCGLAILAVLVVFFNKSDSNLQGNLGKVTPGLHSAAETKMVSNLTTASGLAVKEDETSFTFNWSNSDTNVCVAELLVDGKFLNVDSNIYSSPETKLADKIYRDTDNKTFSYSTARSNILSSAGKKPGDSLKWEVKLASCDKAVSSQADSSHQIKL